MYASAHVRLTSMIHKYVYLQGGAEASAPADFKNMRFTCETCVFKNVGCTHVSGILGLCFHRSCDGSKPNGTRAYSMYIYTPFTYERSRENSDEIVH
jgi:hypothetical protein